jgi:hypothetical protein
MPTSSPRRVRPRRRYVPAGPHGAGRTLRVSAGASPAPYPRTRSPRRRRSAARRRPRPGGPARRSARRGAPPPSDAVFHVHRS